MVELEDIDLAKALVMLAKLCTRLARDIPLELDSPERIGELAGLLEETAKRLRARANASQPKVIDPGAWDGAPG